MIKSILITQCLQNDFVRPISRYDPLPNQLHIGYEEARRLMGENPEEGQVAHTMKWAYEQTDDFMMIHIRDWHNPDDPNHRNHLLQFGNHCIANTWGLWPWLSLLSFVLASFYWLGGGWRKESIPAFRKGQPPKAG